MKNNNELRSGNAYKILIYAALILLALTIIVPVAWVFMASFKENVEFYGNPWTLPKGLNWQNFVDLKSKTEGDWYENNA